MPDRKTLNYLNSYAQSGRECHQQTQPSEQISQQLSQPIQPLQAPQAPIPAQHATIVPTTSSLKASTYNAIIDQPPYQPFHYSQYTHPTYPPSSASNYYYYEQSRSVPQLPIQIVSSQQQQQQQQHLPELTQQHSGQITQQPLQQHLSSTLHAYPLHPSTSNPSNYQSTIQLPVQYPSNFIPPPVTTPPYYHNNNNSHNHSNTTTNNNDNINNENHSFINDRTRTQSELHNATEIETSYKHSNRLVDGNYKVDKKSIPYTFKPNSSKSSVNHFRVDSKLRRSPEVDNWKNAKSVELFQKLKWLNSNKREILELMRVVDNDEKLQSLLYAEIESGSNTDCKIEEFYNHINTYANSKVLKFHSVSQNLSNLTNIWLKMKKIESHGSVDSQPIIDQKFALTLQPSTSSPFATGTQPNKYNLNNLNPTSSYPGESVSLQVVPLRLNDKQQHIDFKSQGVLHPDLSIKMKMVCAHCGSTSTPEWRKGPEDARTLCNACGLFHMKLVKRIGAEAAAKELRKRRENGEQNNRRL